MISTLTSCSKADWQKDKTVHNNYQFERLQLFGGSQEDTAHAVIATNDAGFAVLGNTKSIDGDIEDKSNEVSDIILIKFNTSGEREWSKTYGGSEDDRGHSLVQLTDGGYALLGYSMSADIDATENEGQHERY